MLLVFSCEISLVDTEAKVYASEDFTGFSYGFSRPCSAKIPKPTLKNFRRWKPSSPKTTSSEEGISKINRNQNRKLWILLMKNLILVKPKIFEFWILIESQPFENIRFSRSLNIMIGKIRQNNAHCWFFSRVPLSYSYCRILVRKHRVCFCSYAFWVCFFPTHLSFYLAPLRVHIYTYTISGARQCHAFNCKNEKKKDGKRYIRTNRWKIRNALLQWDKTVK